MSQRKNQSTSNDLLVYSNWYTRFLNAIEKWNIIKKHSDRIKIENDRVVCKLDNSNRPAIKCKECKYYVWSDKEFIYCRRL